MYCNETRSCKVFYSKKITDVNEIQIKLSKVNAYIDSIIQNIKYIENKKAQIREDIERNKEKEKEKERLSNIKNSFLGETVAKYIYLKKKGGRKLKKAKTSKKAKKSKKATKKRILC